MRSWGVGIEAAVLAEWGWGRKRGRRRQARSRRERERRSPSACGGRGRRSRHVAGASFAAVNRGAPETDAHGDAAPDWIRAALRQTLGELREFFRTALAFSRHPGRFADEWYRGEREALNPFGMLATAAAIVASTHQFLPLLVLALMKSAHSIDDGSDSLAPSSSPRSGRSSTTPSSARWRTRSASRRLDSKAARLIGVALYAGAGPGSGAYLLLYLAAMAVTLSGSKFFAGPYAVVAIAPGFLVFAWALCVGLAGLHRVRAWRAGWAIVIAVVVSGLLFGLLPEWPEVFGLHLRLGLARGSISVRFTDV